MIYVRHHGFPSPLLDWTVSPYLAAFFAFDAMREKTECVSVCAFLRDSNQSFSNEQHLFVVGPNIKTHPRHDLQQSQYSMCAKLAATDCSFCSHEEALTGVGQLNGELFKLKIPASERVAALKHLDLMNINPFSVYGSEDALIRTIARRELLFQST